MDQKKETSEHISKNLVYGVKCSLHVTNIVLFGIVIILAIVSICIYFFMPVSDVSKLAKKSKIPGVNKTVPGTESVGTGLTAKEELDDKFYNVITARNVFSPQREDWVVKVVKAKTPKFKDKSTRSVKKAFAGKPKKFVLHGILMAGDIKKALINNPLKGISKQRTLYVEEGEDLEGYTVKSIEKDRIKLDWNGEEIVVLLYSGTKGDKQPLNPGNESLKPRKRIKQMKVNKSDVSREKRKEIENSVVASAISVKDIRSDGGPDTVNVFDEETFDPMSMAYDALFMPEMNDEKVSEQPEIQEAAETLPDPEVADVDSLDEEQGFTMDYSYTKQELSPDNESLKSGNRLDVNISDIPIKKQKEIENSVVASVVGVKDIKSGKGPDVANVFEEEPLEPTSMAYDALFMPEVNDEKISGQPEIQEIAEALSDPEVADVDSSDEEQRLAMVKPSDSIYKVLEEEEIKQKALAEVPAQIILKGVVIAGKIRKALINVPESEAGARTLHVEEGDGFEGYLVVKIEPIQVRLDWKGEEMILTFPRLF